jgi:putative NADPH-quinone reductase
MKKRILIIQGHPNRLSLCAHLADAYEKGARAGGHELSRLDLGELQFDPVLKFGYGEIQALEPDLERAQQLIKAADHLVLIYPNWWGTLPALLKGFIDRVFLPGFGFKYREGSPFPQKLLAGRTAHLITTMDTPTWYYRWIQGAPGTKVMKKMILGFCGIKTTRTTLLGPIRNASEQKLKTYLARLETQGSNGH